MTATPTAAVYRPPTGNVRFTGVLASEWTKLRSLRSTVWSLIAAVGVAVMWRSRGTRGRRRSVP